MKKDGLLRACKSLQIWLVARWLYFCFWECLVWGYSFDPFPFQGKLVQLCVLRLGRVPCKEPVCLFLQRGHCIQPSHLNLEGEKPILLPQRCRDEAVAAACQSLLLSRSPLQETPCSKHTARPEEEEGSLNWAQGGSPTPICKDSLLFDEAIRPGPGTITVAYINSYEAFGWQMLGSHSSHVFEKYFYYRKMLMLWAWKEKKKREANQNQQRQ